MSDTFAWFTSAARDSAALSLLDTGVKATVLLVAACLVAALLHRASAAVRHRVWCLAFAGLLLLPTLSSVLPGWRVPILPELSDASPVADNASVKTADRAIDAPAVPLDRRAWNEPALPAGASGIVPPVHSEWQEASTPPPACSAFSTVARSMLSWPSGVAAPRGSNS